MYWFFNNAGSVNWRYALKTPGFYRYGNFPVIGCGNKNNSGTDQLRPWRSNPGNTNNGNSKIKNQVLTKQTWLLFMLYLKNLMHAAMRQCPIFSSSSMPAWPVVLFLYQTLNYPVSPERSATKHRTCLSTIRTCFPARRRP